MIFYKQSFFYVEISSEPTPGPRLLIVPSKYEFEPLPIQPSSDVPYPSTPVTNEHDEYNPPSSLEIYVPSSESYCQPHLETENYSRPHRITHKPSWLQDYICYSPSQHGLRNMNLKILSSNNCEQVTFNQANKVRHWKVAM